MSKRETIKNYLAETQLFSRRMWFALIVIVFLSVLLLGRLFYLQIIQKELYTTLSRANQFNLIPIEPNRGLIYDRNGVLLAQNIPVLNLMVVPERVPNLKQTISNLQQIISISDDDLLLFQKALKQHHPFESVPLKIKLSEQEAARFYVDQYRYPGVTINAALMRYYPLGQSMTSVVGYVGRINEQDLLNIDTANYNGSNYIGKMGIEKYFEKELHGTVGYQQVEMNANGRIVRTLKHIPTIPGENIYLTVDSNLQRAAQDALGDINGGVVAIQPSTGQVLAMVSNPSYDPNLFVNGISAADYKVLHEAPGKPLYNRAVRGVFPVGSTIKPFMAIGGLDYGVVTPSYTISDPGFFKLPGNNHVWRDWVPHGHGSVNVIKAIMVSCDTYMYGLGVKMGIDRLAANLQRFGFGQKTGIEIEEEISGNVPTPAWKQKYRHAPWYTGDTVSVSIGQGYVTTTPMQLAQAVAVIAERGIRYQPTLILKTQNPDGSFTNKAPILQTPVKLSDPNIWNLVINGMVAVVKDPGGTAYPAWHDTTYSAAAKTGTAQVYAFTGKVTAATPYNLRNHSLFIVFAPVNNPQIAVAVIAEHSLTPAKIIARKIVDYYLLTEHPELINTPTSNGTQ